jgi:nucleotide sugar dehydrogenase
MAVAVASARKSDGGPMYQVTGVDLLTDNGKARVNALNQGIFPFPIADQELQSALTLAKEAGNLTATTDESVYGVADVVVVDVPLDISYLDDEPTLKLSGFESAIRAVARRIPVGALVLIETTVPPGTCEKIATPALQDELRRRGLDKDSVHLAHSSERVMPGDGYLDSIVNFWRAYAGNTNVAADICEQFLTSIVNVEHFPLRRLSSMTASETVKVMENTYRAVNIALIDEWTKYAETLGIDLYEVVDAIRVRPTHSNIRFPGLGVGGYCLTKDPTFAPAAAKQLFHFEKLGFPFSQLAVKVNHNMPLHAVERLTVLLGGSCKGKRILVLGLSYREDIGDTRYSPAETLVRALESRGAVVSGYDPFLTYWRELNWVLPVELPSPIGLDAVVIATAHKQFQTLDIPSWLGSVRPVLLDTANVITAEHRRLCRDAGIRLESVGRGDGL